MRKNKFFCGWFVDVVVAAAAVGVVLIEHKALASFIVFLMFLVLDS